LHVLLRDLGGNALPYSLEHAAAVRVQGSSALSFAVSSGFSDHGDPVVILAISLQSLHDVSLSVHVGGEVIGAGGNFSVFVQPAQCSAGGMEVAGGGLDCQCSPGYYEDGGSCVPCRAGSYKSHPGNGSQSVCVPCPSGYFCLEGQRNTTGRCPSLGFDCSQGTLRLMDGYWMHPLAGDWHDNITLAVTECVNLDACRGSEVSGNSTKGFQGSCAPGYEGQACTTCSQDFAGLSGYCTKCYGPSMSTVAVVCMQAAVVIVVAFLVALVLEETRGVSKVSVFSYCLLDLDLCEGFRHCQVRSMWVIGHKDTVVLHFRILFDMLQVVALQVLIRSLEQEYFVVSEVIAAFTGL
jgi:hypothetical protein